MTLDSLIMLAGTFVAVLPFLGFPNRIDTILFVIAGVFIVIFGILVRRRSSYMRRMHHDTFVEGLPSDKGGVE